ncbi:MAG: 50S ribosomal protein L9 [Actinomycetota bacterium]|nr:50S ribosomal protein L9 [Actinomycetota bacterium]
MQVLLRRDVKGIGRRGDIVTVSSGHARNYLIPNGLAVEATDGAVEQAATVKKSRAVREAADRESARAIATAFAETPLVITAKAGATGKLFGSVTAADIVEAVERQFHVVVERKHVSIEHPIREVGTHQVSVALFADVRGTLNVEVRAG